MKTITFVLITILLVFSVSFSLADGCPLHGVLYAHEYSTRPQYSQNNASTHNVEIIHYFECTYCAEALPAQYWIYITPNGTEAHIKSSSWDGGHVGTTKTHRRCYRCKCQYSWSTLYSCPGNPCIYPNNVGVGE